MEQLLPLAARVAARLKERGETVALAESTTAGLVSAALVAQPGASAYFLGGALIYTRVAGRVLLDLPPGALKGHKPLTPSYAQVLADHFRSRMGADWALAEHGAAGPEGSPYGPGPGTAVIARAGPAPRAILVETGSADRVANMRAFAKAALTLLIEGLEG